MIPKTFVQIHYHDRPGGVRQVMEKYVGAYRACAPQGGIAAVICHASSGYRFPCRTVDVPECDYRPCAGRDQYSSDREVLISKLTALLTSTAPARPVAVMGHNLNLGKNVALSSAFSECARRYGCDTVRFYSVIHDFPEEGRADLMAGVCALENDGVPVRDDLYSVRAPVLHLSTGFTGYRLLRKAGFVGRYFPDPVDFPAHAQSLSGARRKAVVGKGRNSGIHLRSSRPIYCYPSRIIPRKNVLEAILMACGVFEGNLLLGSFGSSPDDRRLKTIISKMIRQYDLPVLCDAARVIRGGGNSLESPSLFAYEHCDIAVSTSISEGFGYALFEPWGCGRYLIGRQPVTYSPPPGIRFGSLYKRFPVPVQWVDLEDLSAKYQAALQASFGKDFKEREFNRRFRRSMVSAGAVDFGCLDIGSQVGVLDRVFGSQSERKQLLRFLEREQPGWPGQIKFHDDRTTRRNKEISSMCSLIVSSFGLQSFTHHFEKVITTAVPLYKSPDTRTIEHFFSPLSRFRLLQSRTTT